MISIKRNLNEYVSASLRVQCLRFRLWIAFVLPFVSLCLPLFSLARFVFVCVSSALPICLLDLACFCLRFCLRLPLCLLVFAYLCLLLCLCLLACCLCFCLYLLAFPFVFAFVCVRSCLCLLAFPSFWQLFAFILLAFTFVFTGVCLNSFAFCLRRRSIAIAFIAEMF